MSISKMKLIKTNQRLNIFSSYSQLVQSFFAVSNSNNNNNNSQSVAYLTTSITISTFSHINSQLWPYQQLVCLWRGDSIPLHKHQHQHQQYLSKYNTIVLHTVRLKILTVYCFYQYHLIIVIIKSHKSSACLPISDINMHAILHSYL